MNSLTHMDQARHLLASSSLVQALHGPHLVPGLLGNVNNNMIALESMIDAAVQRRIQANAIMNLAASSQPSTIASVLPSYNHGLNQSTSLFPPIHMANNHSLNCSLPPQAYAISRLHSYSEPPSMSSSLPPSITQASRTEQVHRPQRVLNHESSRPSSPVVTKQQSLEDKHVAAAVEGLLMKPIAGLVTSTPLAAPQLQKQAGVCSPMPDLVGCGSDMNSEKGVDALHRCKQSFPEKIYFMLEEMEQNGKQEIVSFVADGKAFMIHKPHAFERETMPLFFSSSRMASFQRQLNIYGFVRIHEGPWRGAYRHKYFQKDQKHLLSRIKQSVPDSKKKVSSAACA